MNYASSLTLTCKRFNTWFLLDLILEVAFCFQSNVSPSTFFVLLNSVLKIKVHLFLQN